MLLINLILKLKIPREIFTLGILIIWCPGKSQKSLMDSILVNYQTPVLSYSFEEKYFSFSSHFSTVRSGTVYCLNEGGSTAHIIIYNKQGRIIEVIMNENYYGLNDRGSGCFVDYKNNPPPEGLFNEQITPD